MADKIRFTTDYKIECGELIEGTTVNGKLPFSNDKNHNVHASEFIEDDAATNITYDSNKKITCYRFIEENSQIGGGTTADPIEYITTFIPEITYSTTTGMKITNLSTLLSATGTDASYWQVGIIQFHRMGASRTNLYAKSRRHFKTSWGYYNGDEDRGYIGANISLNSDGTISNSNGLHNKGGLCRDVYNTGDNKYSVIGVRLRPFSRTSVRSKYSSIFYKFQNGSQIGTESAATLIENVHYM